MTYSTLKHAGFTFLMGLIFSVSLPATSAMADEVPVDNFQVMKTSDGLIKLGVKAYKRGNYERAAILNEQATRSSLSKNRLAVALSNLCASYGKMDMNDKAKVACVTALELRPNYAPAQANMAALTFKLAQNTP